MTIRISNVKTTVMLCRKPTKDKNIVEGEEAPEPIKDFANLAINV
jgi:hypothetical protein